MEIDAPLKRRLIYPRGEESDDAIGWDGHRAYPSSFLIGQKVEQPQISVDHEDTSPKYSSFSQISYIALNK